jgi:hypothetical protein
VRSRCNSRIVDVGLQADRTDRAGLDCALDLATARCRGCGVVEQDFVSAKTERLGRRVTTLRVALATIQIDYDAQRVMLGK